MGFFSRRLFFLECGLEVIFNVNAKDVDHGFTVNRLICCLFLSPFLGCISPSHLGVRQWNKCELTCRTLNKKTALACEEFEKEIIHEILSSNIDPVRISLSPKFSQNMLPVEWEKIKEKIRTYGFSGDVSYGRFVHRSFSLDEASSWDGFRAFDFIASIHYLNGKKDGQLILCFRKKTEHFELVGMSLSPKNEEPSDANSFKYLYLENVEGNESIFCPCGLLLS